jgi:hypothetical protein
MDAVGSWLTSGRHTEAELGLLLERARSMLSDPGQGEFDLGVEPTPRKAGLLAPAGDAGGLFPQPRQEAERPRVAAPKVLGTCSRLLFDVLAEVYDGLGFAVVGDETFRDLVIARIVEPTSILDTGRVLTDLGKPTASEKTMRRTLSRCGTRGYREAIATACFNHAMSKGDVSLCLYDVTTLLCRRRHNRVYVTNIPTEVMPAGEVIASYHDLWNVEQSFRMSKTDLRARPMSCRRRHEIGYADLPVMPISGVNVQLIGSEGARRSA